MKVTLEFNEDQVVLLNQFLKRTPHATIADWLCDLIGSYLAPYAALAPPGSRVRKIHNDREQAELAVRATVMPAVRIEEGVKNEGGIE